MVWGLNGPGKYLRLFGVRRGSFCCPIQFKAHRRTKETSLSCVVQASGSQPQESSASSPRVIASLALPREGSLPLDSVSVPLSSVWSSASRVTERVNIFHRNPGLWGPPAPQHAPPRHPQLYWFDTPSNHICHSLRPFHDNMTSNDLEIGEYFWEISKIDMRLGPTEMSRSSSWDFRQQQHTLHKTSRNLPTWGCVSPLLHATLWIIFQYLLFQIYVTGSHTHYSLAIPNIIKIKSTPHNSIYAMNHILSLPLHVLIKVFSQPVISVITTIHVLEMRQRGPRDLDGVPNSSDNECQLWNVIGDHLH